MCPGGREQAVPLAGVDLTGDDPCNSPPMVAADLAAGQISAENKVSPSSPSDSRSRRRCQSGTRVSALLLLLDLVVLKDLNEVEPDEVIDAQQGDEELAPWFPHPFRGIPGLPLCHIYTKTHCMSGTFYLKIKWCSIDKL